jgi:GTPase SAR1 family protein
MIIEFIGPAGSGKTYLVRKLATELRKENFEVLTYDDLGTKNKLEKIGLLMKVLLKRPLFFLKMSKRIFSQNRNLKSKLFGVSLLIRSMGRYELARKKDCIIVFDETFVNGIESFVTATDKPNIKWIEEYAKIIKGDRKYLFVFINYNKEEVFSRRIKRQHDCDRGIHPLLESIRLNNLNETYEYLKEILNNKPNCQVKEIWN